jgi:hypothetical protein
MPIRAENKARYPADWPAISAAVRARANNRCEECGVENYAIGCRAADGSFLPAQPSGTNGFGGLAWPRPGDYAWCVRGERAEWGAIIRIVLTVAHLNHKPEDCRPENLRCWCQRCHNRYDAAERRRGIQARARILCASGDLFEA